MTKRNERIAEIIHGLRGDASAAQNDDFNDESYEAMVKALDELALLVQPVTAVPIDSSDTINVYECDNMILHKDGGKFLISHGYNDGTATDLDGTVLNTVPTANVVNYMLARNGEGDWGMLFKAVEYGRPPTESEIKFGHGARHYKHFPAGMVATDICWVPSMGQWTWRLKKRFKCPQDGLIYTRS